VVIHSWYQRRYNAQLRLVKWTFVSKPLEQVKREQYQQWAAEDERKQRTGAVDVELI
jgi:hypothetical protein